MSSLITKPEYLSKDRLKSELKIHGIRFNQNENKQYYVNLYRKRLIDTEQSRHEFSTDEELTRPPKQEKKQQKRKKTVKMDTYMPDVQLLNDAELREELEKFDKDIGPLTDSTRVLYQRMLAKLMAENVTGKSGVSSKVQPRDSTEEEEDDEGGVNRNNSYVGEWSSEDSDEEEEDKPVRPSPPLPSSQLKKRGSGVREQAPPPAKESERPREKVYRRTAPKSTSLQGFIVLLLMFAIAFFSYEHYTSTEEDPSLITKGWRKSSCLWSHVQDYIIKTPSSKPDSEPPSTNNDPPPTEEPTPPPTEEPTPPPTEEPTPPPTEEPPKTQPPPKKTTPPPKKTTPPPKKTTPPPKGTTEESNS